MNRTKQISANALLYPIVMVLLASSLASKSYAETCVGTSPRICADFINAGDPFFPDDFDVTGGNIILKKGALDWRVWSQVSASDTTPADFGSITLNPSVPADDFEVQIKNGTTGGVGAANVGTINLNDAGFTGFSSIGGSSISGNLTGGLTVVQDSGANGGEVSFSIDGDVSGAMTIPVLQSLTIGGDLSVKIDVTDEINGTGFTSTGSVTTTGELEVADIASGNISFIKRSETFAGTLDLENGIPSGTLVKFETPLTSDGVLDLGGGGVAGTLRIIVDNAADIINGGAVTGTATLSGRHNNSR